MKIAKAIERAADLLYIGPVRKIIPHRLFLYSMMGAGNTGLGWLLYWFVFNYIATPLGYLNLGFVVMSPPILALFIQFPITFILGFWLNRNVSFKSSTLRGRTQLVRYMLSTGGAFLLNYLLLKLFVEVLGVAAPSAKILNDIVITAYSYLMQKHFSFRSNKQDRR